MPRTMMMRAGVALTVALLLTMVGLTIGGIASAAAPKTSVPRGGWLCQHFGWFCPKPSPPTTTSTTSTTTTPTTTTATATTTTTATTTSTPTTTTATTTSPTPPPAQPTGDPGNWTLKFDDEFSGTSLDTSKWTAITWNNSNVTGDPADVSVSGGDLNLMLSKAGSGSTRGAGGFVESNGFQLPVGGFMEASIEFPGPGTTPGTSIDNWSGFWASGADWPANGEEDAVETLGSATSNYHSPAGTNNSGPIAGNWSNSFHTYGMYRGAKSVTIYWDGKIVRTYATSDAGGVQEILLDAASSTGPDTTINSSTVTGAASTVKVAYVRAWVPS